MSRGGVSESGRRPVRQTGTSLHTGKEGGDEDGVECVVGEPTKLGAQDVVLLARCGGDGVGEGGDRDGGLKDLEGES